MRRPCILLLKLFENLPVSQPRIMPGLKCHFDGEVYPDGPNSNESRPEDANLGAGTSKFGDDK
jgi:hypothetical protein